MFDVGDHFHIGSKMYAHSAHVKRDVVAISNLYESAEKSNNVCMQQTETNVISNNIDRLRKSRKMTIESLASKSGLSRGYLQDLKAGRKNWNMRVLKSLAETLNCNVSDIISEGINQNILLLSGKIADHILNRTRQRLTNEQYLELVGEIYGQLQRDETAIEEKYGVPLPPEWYGTSQDALTDSK